MGYQNFAITLHFSDSARLLKHKYGIKSLIMAYYNRDSCFSPLNHQTKL